MDKTTLQALRRSLFFSRQEAALWVAAGADRPNGVTDRSWRMWEDGSRPIPADIAETITRLIAWRAESIKKSSDIIKGQSKPRSNPDAVCLIWYETPADWVSLAGREAIFWRPQQSVCAALQSIFTTVRLIPFNRDSFALWRAQNAPSLPDSEQLRSRWAASIQP